MELDESFDTIIKKVKDLLTEQNDSVLFEIKPLTNASTKTKQAFLTDKTNRLIELQTILITLYETRHQLSSMLYQDEIARVDDDHWLMHDEYRNLIDSEKRYWTRKEVKDYVYRGINPNESESVFVKDTNQESNLVTADTDALIGMIVNPDKLISNQDHPANSFVPTSNQESKQVDSIEESCDSDKNNHS